MKILMIYPETPATFWSFKDALKFVSKKSAEPPLGLITVASMLPAEWEKRLIDLNVTRLEDEDILWADYVFLSGMNIHTSSIRKIIRKCNNLDKPIVGGGPLFTFQYNDFPGIDHFVLNEAELTLPQFLSDLSKGRAERVYSTNEYPELGATPVPMWELLEMDKYASMSIQYSRGCPYDCEFCSITVLNGRRPRTKSSFQFIAELDRLYQLGWRGGVSIVDDNFIGNKRLLKSETLPAIIKWQQEKGYPFNFITEVSINLADDEELIAQMINAGINSVFVGIETTDPDSLNECGKKQNLRRNLELSVKKLIGSGMIVSGGFIVGFDSDKPGFHKQYVDFIQSSGIVSAMVGLLNAPNGTKLYNRLKKENRLIDNFSGNNMDGFTNIVPRMNYKELIKGYTQIIKKIYSPKEYYNRIRNFVDVYRVPDWPKVRFTFREFKAFFMILWKLGILDAGKRYFWKVFFYTVKKYPKKFPLAMTFAVYGYHFRKISARITN
ncbi:B12-binding domain-containing radical SAM protein [Melioribacter sp. OK-6-Me]|uniref:B12-binding domain-containing radical SAM protein n=1 Tax=unclassified Melioribacter TaxID=2627329 RepID=UPI003ED8C5E0